MFDRIVTKSTYGLSHYRLITSLVGITKLDYVLLRYSYPAIIFCAENVFTTQLVVDCTIDTCVLCRYTARAMSALGMRESTFSRYRLSSKYNVTGVIIAQKDG